MEYLTHDGHISHKIYITKQFVDIQDTRYPVNKVSLFTENEGKLQTDINIIRYTKGSLYLYDTKHNLIRVYLFSKKYNKEPEIEFGSYSDLNHNSNDILEHRFSLKPGAILELYKKDDNTYYIKRVNVGYKDIIEKVKTVYGVGESKVYITEESNNLRVSKKYKCTFNGCPVGKYM